MVIYYKEHKKIFFTLLVLVFIFYGNSLKNKYALDDDYVTVTNFPEKGKQFTPNHKLVSKGLAGIPKIWQSRYAHDSEGSFSYRPVTTTTFAIEYSIFGQNPFISHLVNLLLYFLTIWLLFCILHSLFESYENNLMLAFLCSLLFLIHPIHTEVVNNLKCRDELLAFFFSLMALWYSLKAYKKVNFLNIFLIILFLLLGMLSKRTAILFFAVIPLCFIFFRKVSIKRVSFMLSMIFSIYVLSLVIKVSLITEKNVRHFYHFENPLYTDTVSLLHKLIIGVKTLGFYVKFLIFPFPFRNYYGANTFDISQDLNLYFFIGIIFLLSCIFFIYKQKNKLLLFSILLFLGCVFPFVNVVSPAPGVLGERFAYFSSLGFCLIIVVVIAPYFKNIKLTSYSQFFTKPLNYLLPIILICMIYIWNRNSNWNSKLVLFEHDINYLEKSAKANSLLANEYFEMLRSSKKKYSDQVLIQKCIHHYSLAVSNDSSFFSAYNNVGVVYFSYLNNVPMAKKHFMLAIRHRPEYAQAYENLGNCYKQEKDIAIAYECYKKSLKINPKQYSAFISCINLFFDAKQYNKAIDIIKNNGAEFSNNYEVVAQEGNCYLMKGDTLTAIEKYEEAYRLNPDKNIAQYISKKYFEIGDSINGAKYQNK